MSEVFAGERAVVVGAGVAGVAAARALVEEGAEVLVTEEGPDASIGAPLGELRSLGVDVRSGGHDPSHLEGATIVVTSPGVQPDAPLLAQAAQLGVPVWGELELGARLARVPYLAVTGTNGKTTTTGMIEACLRAGGVDAVACGNIGHPFPLAARERHEVLVVEASSFQLRFVETFHPKVSVLLNLAPDHVDWHGSFEAYAQAKAKVFAAQASGDVHVGNADDDRAARISSSAPCRVVWFRRDAPGDGESGFDRDELVSRIDGTERLGSVPAERAGYRADAAAAAAAAIAFGSAAGDVRAGLAAYRPAAHRGETVAEIGTVRFVDNSKATNVHAALAALATAPGAILIAGGRAKGVDLSPLAASNLAGGVVAIGEAGPELLRLFAGRVPVRPAETIEDATRMAYELAGEEGTVLLAPACASWDMFRDYAERGDRFAAAARALRQGVGARG